MGAQEQIVGILDHGEKHTNPKRRRDSPISISHSRAVGVLQEMEDLESIGSSHDEVCRLRNIVFAELVRRTQNNFGISLFCSARDECIDRLEREREFDDGLMDYWKLIGVDRVTTGYGPFLMEKPIHAANLAGIETLGIPLNSLQGEHSHRSADPMAHPKQILGYSHIDDRCSCFDAVSDLVVVLSGGIGTFREVAELLQKVQLQRDNGSKTEHPFLHRWRNGRKLLTPILLVGTMADRYRDLLNAMVEIKTISPRDPDLIKSFSTLWEATEFIEYRIKEWKNAAPLSEDSASSVVH